MSKKNRTLGKARRPNCCEICGRAVPLSKHHLIPRAVHGKNRFISKYGKHEMRKRGLMLCKECHNGIHDLIPDEKELARSYHTKELLLSNEQIVKHIAWVKKQR
jgi:hypothetical protein